MRIGDHLLQRGSVGLDDLARMLGAQHGSGLRLCSLLVTRGVRWLARPGPWLGLAIALLLGLPWFVSVSRMLPGAAEYFLSNQVSGRLFDDSYDRNGQWYRAFTLYLPTVALGTLPWSLAVPWMRRRRAGGPTPLAAPGLAARSPIFLAAWTLLPFVVFSLAKSRLPLYLLPIFAPLAVVLAALVPQAVESPGGKRPLAFAAWVLVLLMLKLAAAEVPARRDGARAAEFVSAELAAFPAELWAVDVDLWALPLYGAPEPRRAHSSISARGTRSSSRMRKSSSPLISSPARSAAV